MEIRPIDVAGILSLPEGCLVKFNKPKGHAYISDVGVLSIRRRGKIDIDAN
jgi:hypothetical protein